MVGERNANSEVDYLETENGNISSNIALYLKNRFEKQSDWYGKKARENKARFHTTQSIIIIASAIIPIVNLMDFANLETRIISSILGVLIVGVSGFVQLKKYQENWLLFRVTRELLKKEKQLFLQGAGDYSKMTSSDKNQLFVERVESIISSETSKFLKTHRKGTSG